jgi:hypothetical protein
MLVPQVLHHQMLQQQWWPHLSSQALQLQMRGLLRGLQLQMRGLLEF